MRRPAERVSAKGVLHLLRAVPLGRVVPIDLLASEIGCTPVVVNTLLNALTDDERQSAPWHRVVAKGGAIGRGPHRDQQFAKLVREGVPVSPAGIVQDMARVAVTAAQLTDALAAGFAAGSPIRGEAPAAEAVAASLPSRSRGMKDRPG